MDDKIRRLAANLARLTLTKRRKRLLPALATDRMLRSLAADLVAARTAAGLTQEEVAARMATTNSVISRLENGTRTRPTLSTIERYASAVGAVVEIRVRTRRTLRASRY